MVFNKFHAFLVCYLFYLLCPIHAISTNGRREQPSKRKLFSSSSISSSTSLSSLSSFSHPTESTLLRDTNHRHDIMARFLSKHESLVSTKGEHDVNVISNTTKGNGTNNTMIDWGDAPKTIVTDGESVFESVPEREANVLVDDFLNGRDPLKWIYPSTTLLNEVGITNASKMSYGFINPDPKNIPL
jgi:hypothetical protein